MNDTLPPIPAWQTRSFLAGLLLLLTLLLKAFGIELGPLLAGLGWGDSPMAVINTIEQLLPILLSLWMYVERMAPQYRIVFRKVRR